jgi:serine/threonine-protein kinase
MENDNYIGRLLDGRYEILELIGTGGMAHVYKARCHRLNRLVAIKILKDEYSQDEEFRNRFHGESQSVAMFSHPNIVSVYDVSSSPSADYIVMELIDGITLKHYMEKKETLNWKETLHFAIQIAKALEHAHSRGIVHRDIKPHNVMVLKNGSVKVTDFGIAQVMAKSNTLTKEALGSVHYISPEQAKGGRVDNRSDLYSLGVVMYEMITGRVPYDGESPVSIAIQHISGGAVKPSLLNPNIPTGLEQIIRKSMALSPAKRYATATAMLYDMDEFRKEPTMVFVDAPVSVDGATRQLPTEEELAEQPIPEPKTIAERAAQPKPVRRKPEPKPQPKPQENERNRVATIAITACVVVGIVAVIVIAVILAGMLGKPDMVTVPDLIGQRYDSLENFEGIEVVEVEGGGQYSEKYEKGVIMDQRPRGGEKVANPTKVFVTISRGAKPPAKYMEDLTDGVTVEAAKAHLDGLKLELNYLIRVVQSDKPKDHVIRTDPVAGTELEQGQTVTLWISTGPSTEVIMAEMPNVVGRTIAEATKILNANGFLEIRENPVDSDKPKGQVLAQSEEKFVKIDVTTIIILDVSTGIPQITTNPSDPDDPDAPTDPTEPSQPGDPQEPVTLEYAFIIPSKDNSYTLTIKVDDQVYLENTILPGTTQYIVPLTGNGVVAYDLYIDGEYFGREMVDFSIDG